MSEESGWRPARDSVERELDAMVPAEMEWEPTPGRGLASLSPDQREAFMAEFGPGVHSELPADVRARLDQQAAREVYAEFLAEGRHLGDPEGPPESWDSPNDALFNALVRKRFHELCQRHEHARRDGRDG